MELIELTAPDRTQYNAFVAAQQGGSFLQSWEWGDWQTALGRHVFRYWVLDDIGVCILSVQLIKMPLPFGKYYLYASYGPVVRGSEGPRVGSRIVSELKNKFPHAVFVRIEPKDNFEGLASIAKKSANIQPAKTLIIDLAKPEEQLLADMHPKTRYNIKVAQKHNIEIKDEFDISIGHGLFFDEALKLITETAVRQKFNAFPPGYYKKMVDFFVVHKKISALAEEKNMQQSVEASAKEDALHNRGALKLHIYKAIYNNQLLGAAIMLDFSVKGKSTYGGGTRTFLFGGSSSEHKNVMAPYLLHWQAIVDAKAEGFGTYDFWGVETSGGETPGFVRFKFGFGGQEKQYSGAFDLINKSLPYKFYSGVRVLNKLKRKISG